MSTQTLCDCCEKPFGTLDGGFGSHAERGDCRADVCEVCIRLLRARSNGVRNADTEQVADRILKKLFP